ncbi:hypothetical protein [Lysobacter sp. HA35]
MAARTAALVTALLVAVSAAPAAAADREVETLYKKTLDMHGCSEQFATDDVVERCRQVIAAYRAAEAASDATSDDHAFLAAKRLQYQATLVGVLRTESDDRDAARKELDAALQELDVLAPDKASAFVRVQTLDLQRQAALLELDGGSPERADAAIRNYREYAQGFLSVVDQFRDNKKAMNQQRVNAVDAANFEMELGDHYAKMLEDGDATNKDEIRRKAVEAYETARQWAIARANNDWNGFAQKTPAAMYSDASLALAQLAHEVNDTTALATYVSEAKAVACTEIDAGNGYDDSELKNRCLRTMLMEGWVTGVNQALMRKISADNEARLQAVIDTLRKKD